MSYVNIEPCDKCDAHLWEKVTPPFKCKHCLDTGVRFFTQEYYTFDGPEIVSTDEQR